MSTSEATRLARQVVADLVSADDATKRLGPSCFSWQTRSIGWPGSWTDSAEPPDSGLEINQSTQQLRRTPQMVTYHRVSVEGVR